MAEAETNETGKYGEEERLCQAKESKKQTIKMGARGRDGEAGAGR
jgi:hypothetical protein